MNKAYKRLLTIAGSDSGGGAGIQADLKTFSALGCYAMSVITALTAQNTTGVTGIYPIPASFVRDQMEAVLSDIGADAVKIGMLYSPELIETVAGCLTKFDIPSVVVDPVMVAQSGDKLVTDDAIDALKHYMMPLATVVTPNLPEAEVLTGQDMAAPERIREAAGQIAALGCGNVLIKGGHAEQSGCEDLLYMGTENRFVTLASERVTTHNNHGTGCTLSSAIAAYLAKGDGIETAVKNAKTYITETIRAGAGYKLGHGHGPVHHFYAYWP